MCKKITLIIAVVVLLIGVQSLIAQERDADRPRESGLRDPARPTERQPVMREPVERGDIEPGRRERAGRGDQPEPGPPVAVEGRRRPALPMAPVKTGPVQEEFGKWLDELTKAYRANDRGKMGEIIRQMQQFRQQQIPGKVVNKRGPDYDQGPKKVEKVRPDAEKKAPKVAEKVPQAAKKLPQVWKDQQGGFPGGPAGWGGCPWCGRCPRCGAMGGQRMGMGFQQGGFGRGRPDVSPPVMDKQAPPMAPKDVTGPEPLRMRRGMGGWRMGMGFQQRGFGRFRPEGPLPPVMDKPVAPGPPEDVVRPMLPEPPRGPARRGWGPALPMNPTPGGLEPKPQPAEPRED